MPELLENGGKVDLWGGWSIDLPRSYYQRNEDGTWSAWGTDWAVDIQIIEIGGDSAGNPVSGEVLSGKHSLFKLSGNGWLGKSEILPERDGDRTVYRLAGTLASANTVMSCWISYFTVDQAEFANSILTGVSHI